MTNKFNIVLHELIHVANTYDRKELPLLFKLNCDFANHLFKSAAHAVECKSDLCAGSYSGGFLFLPSKSRKFKIGEKIKIYYVDANYKSSVLHMLDAIAEGMCVDWYATLAYGKFPHWEEFNRLETVLDIVSKQNDPHKIIALDCLETSSLIGEWDLHVDTSKVVMFNILDLMLRYYWNYYTFKFPDDLALEGRNATEQYWLNDHFWPIDQGHRGRFYHIMDMVLTGNIRLETIDDYAIRSLVDMIDFYDKYGYPTRSVFIDTTIEILRRHGAIQLPDWY